MGGRRRNLIVLLVVVALCVLSAVVVVTKKTVLGLDLKGGTQLVYVARPTAREPVVTAGDIDRAIEIIRQRADKLGVSEPEISRVGKDEVQVGLPNVENAKRAIDQIGTTSQLYLYDFEANVIPPPNSSAPNKPAKAAAQNPTVYSFPNAYEAVKFAHTQKANCFENQCTATGPTYYLFDAQSHEQRGDAAENPKDIYRQLQLDPLKKPKSDVLISVPQGTVVLSEPAEDNPNTSADESATGASHYYVLKDRPALTGSDITDPKQNFDPQTNQPLVTFNFTDQGRSAFQTVTRRIALRGQATAPPGTTSAAAASAYSQHFSVVLDGEIKSSPIINFVENPDGIDGRTGAEISGNFTIQSAQDLASFLQIGAIPVNLHVISQSTVSATLGQQALDQGLKAGIIGLLIVIAFLILYYRLLGLVAVVGLAIYALFFFALIKLIPITLTLPGIAGLVLTIGVAADANIVIFERIKEEVRAGRSTLSAIGQGYRRGIATIIDANVITLLTAFILFGLATAGVKGFAFTLGIGTIVSLFTAVLFTQAFLGLFSRSRLLHSPWALGAGEKHFRWNFDFTGASKWFFSMSGAILAIGAISLAVNQLNFGIDFESGTRIEVGLQKAATVDEVRTALEDAEIGGAGSAEIQSIQNQTLGDNAFQIQAQIPQSDVNDVPGALQTAFGVKRALLFESDRRPDVRLPGGPQRGHRDHLLALRDLDLRGAAVRGQVRDPRPDRARARRAHHGGRLLGRGKGVDERHRRGIPDHPRILDVRHDHRVRPSSRERAAHAAGRVLADRQPLDERGPHPIADHRPLDRLPGDRPVHLRRRHAQGLRFRDDDRGPLRCLLVDLHRLAGADPLEGARARVQVPPPAPAGGDGVRPHLPGGQRGREDRRGRPRPAAGRRAAGCSCSAAARCASGAGRGGGQRG